jgi:acetyl-CoA carboxylase biotin carboxyl carrier protein
MARRRTATPEALELVGRLGSLLAELGLSGIEVTVGDLHVRVERTAGGVAPPAAIAPAGTAPAVSDVAPEALLTMEAPMVGTFYRASSPTAEPFAREGDVVKEGQVLCIIEAMKLMNEIEAKAAGRVVKILVENGQPVEYGQPLFLIDPQR